VDSNRFFRVVWRLNAVLLALGGILIIGFAASNLLFTPHWQPAPEGVFAPVPKDAEKDSTYRLEPTSVGFTGESILSLHKWKGAPRSYGLAATELRDSSSYASAVDGVNLLALNDATGTGHWLFHGYRRAVLSEMGMTREGAAPVPGVVPNAVALVIRTIDADTNNDGELAEKDRQSLYFYRPGMQFAEKFLDADHIISREQTDTDSFLVVYERGKSAIAATYGIPGFKLKSEKQVPSVPN
jgi:hypothetical protein